MHRPVRTALSRGAALVNGGLAVSLALVLAACGEPPPAPPAEGGPPAEAEAPAREIVFGGSPALIALETVPTQDELDAEVAAELDAEDADAAYEALRAILESDPMSR